MDLYIYRLEDNVHVATISGETNDSCEAKAESLYTSNDYGWTYSPSFGAADGLKENPDAEEVTIEADA